MRNYTCAAYMSFTILALNVICTGCLACLVGRAEIVYSARLPTSEVEAPFKVD